VPTVVFASATIGRDNEMTVMIGVDPHKRSHTAVAIDGDDVELAAIEVRSSVRQVDELLGWAAGFADRTWAVEGAGGVGYLLAQQLVAAGERVLDVPATLAARVRVLGSGRSNKNDPNDGYSIAVAARHSPRLQLVVPADHAAVLRLLAKRNRELGGSRTRTACRLHALLVDLVPGGISKQITANRAAALLATVTPTSAVAATRHALALEHLEDLRRIDEGAVALSRVSQRVSQHRSAARAGAECTGLGGATGVRGRPWSRATSRSNLPTSCSGSLDHPTRPYLMPIGRVSTRAGPPQRSARNNVTRSRRSAGYCRVAAVSC
jgi:Transposase